MDDDENNIVSIASDGYDSYNVPERIFHHQNNGRHWVHKIYRKLKTPLKSGTLTKENLCIPCCCSFYGKPRDSHQCKKFVKSSAHDNLKKYINKMYPKLIPAEPSIQEEVAKKQAKYNNTASISILKFMKRR